MSVGLSVAKLGSVHAVERDCGGQTTRLRAWLAVMLALAAAIALLIPRAIPAATDRVGAPVAAGSAQAVAAGLYTACALLAGDEVGCWGWNDFAQLGIGTRGGPLICHELACAPSPIALSTLSGATAVAVGGRNGCAVLAGGGVDCWGNNSGGQLGIGSHRGPDRCSGAACSRTPIPVSAISSATQVSVGRNHACALLRDGTIDCWGDNDSGQLGDGSSRGPQHCGTEPCATAPVAVRGITDATEVSAGEDFTCALLRDGTIDCWGSNLMGEIASGSRTGPATCGGIGCARTPHAVSAITTATQISAGSDGACALLRDGTVDCWGDNEAGEIGDGANTGPQRCVGGYACALLATPVSALTGATAVATGGAYACALLAGGSVVCWGSNTYGTLGDGSLAGPHGCATGACATTPVTVAGIATATQISAGYANACALLGSGATDCWGDGSVGELGIGAHPSLQRCDDGDRCSATPVAVHGIG